VFEEKKGNASQQRKKAEEKGIEKERRQSHCIEEIRKRNQHAQEYKRDNAVCGSREKSEGQRAPQPVPSEPVMKNVLRRTANVVHRVRNASQLNVTSTHPVPNGMVQRPR